MEGGEDTQYFIVNKIDSPLGITRTKFMALQIMSGNLKVGLDIHTFQYSYLLF